MLTAAVLAAARATVGTKETLPNSGPEIDEWLANVKQKPGNPWCMAWAWSMYEIGAKACGLANPCPRTAGSLRAWELADDAYRSRLPRTGSLFVMRHLDADGQPDGLGHVGIVEAVLPSGYVTTIEGNTNGAGSRNGDSVARHTWRWEDQRRGKLELVGFLVFEQEVGHA